MFISKTAYHYYLDVYRDSAVTRYDTHKKSELRNVYNSMVKVNKDSPLYKLRNDVNIPKFLIDIKENARQAKNVISSLSDSTDGLESSFQKKVAVSSDDGIVSASYIGSNQDDISHEYEIEVLQLAAPQSNLGNFLDSRTSDFEPGDYAFDLITTTNSYEFQFTVNSEDTNRSIQEKLARLFNTSGVGVSAEIIMDEKNRSSLKLTSKQTGLSDSKSSLFDIKPKASSQSIEAMELLGIDQITSPAQNSAFILNGTEHSSYSNTFTLNKEFELTLHGISPEDTTTRIGFKTSVDSVADNLQELVDSYNGFIQTGERYSGSQQGNRLLHDFKNVSYTYRNNLESIGLMIGNNGHISVDRNLLADAVETKDFRKSFSILNSFKNALAAKADIVSVDPIRYVDKTIVTYKQPGVSHFPSPYHNSLYSGMMLDHIC
ncbi:MAG: flagellar filament capping protein FliD [Eubacterium sp.]|nr:flagellar filament capping protein FliD [Eubacterium sp.]